MIRGLDISIQNEGITIDERKASEGVFLLPSTQKLKSCTGICSCIIIKCRISAMKNAQQIIVVQNDLTFISFVSLSFLRFANTLGTLVSCKRQAPQVCRVWN